METTAYRTIQPPFHSLKFRELSRRELKEYDRWFHDVSPRRIDDLANEVNSFSGFEGWRPSYAPDSLNFLGAWFKTQVKTRQHTEAELSSIPLHVREWVVEGELTDRTISLAMDVGMYLSQVLLRNNPSLKWNQIFGSKNFIDYGQPVLVGFSGDLPFNPVRMVITMAYSLAKKTRDEKALRELYDIWSGMAKR